MKITFNVEKKHLYLLVLFIVLGTVTFVIATGYTGQQSHPTLFTNTIRSRDSDTVTVQDKLSAVWGSSQISTDVAVDVRGGALNLNGNKIVGIDWPGSTPLGNTLYRNTALCDTTTSNSNAVTTVASCSKPTNACVGTFNKNGQSCSIFNGNPSVCNLIGSCFYKTPSNTCLGNIVGVSCTDYSTSTNCNTLANGCSWQSSAIAYNAPLGRLVNF